MRYRTQPPPDEERITLMKAELLRLRMDHIESAPEELQDVLDINCTQEREWQFSAWQHATIKKIILVVEMTSPTHPERTKCLTGDN